MAKTKPIGVRFDEKILEDLDMSPQKALNFLTDYFYNPPKKEFGDIIKMKVHDRILRSLNDTPTTDKPIYKYPLEEKDCIETQNKPQEATKKENEGESMPKVDNSLILAEIEKVKSAKKPDGMGIKVWEFDQNKKLKMLNSQLK